MPYLSRSSTRRSSRLWEMTREHRSIDAAYGCAAVPEPSYGPGFSSIASAVTTGELPDAVAE
jgi:hypothetical protein